MNRWPHITHLAVLFSLAACSSTETPAPAADLPSAFTGAIRLTDFQQAECDGSPYGDAGAALRERIEGAVEGRSILASYVGAHFRCAQDVEGFVRTSGSALDVLVQPVDMNPAAIARCDCLYRITFSVPVTDGQHVLSLYRRWDHKSGSDQPTRIGSLTVEVPPDGGP
ncbi:MAG TPA: hypothetical protein VF395_21675 [Polyangiaceae bacterium]